jgi:hypothetical protein
MDDTRFDLLTRRVVLGGAGVALAALLGWSATDAKGKKRRRRKRKKRNAPRCPAGVVTCNGDCCVPGQSCLGPLFGCANGDIAVDEPCDPEIPAACSSGNCGCNGAECFCRISVCRATDSGCLADHECCSGFCLSASHCAG